MREKRGREGIRLEIAQGSASVKRETAGELRKVREGGRNRGTSRKEKEGEIK